MTKTRYIVGFFAGIAMIGLALATVPLTANATSAAGVEPGLCPLTEVALDEGYGVTRTELRLACLRR